MKTEVMAIDPVQPNANALAQAGEIIRRGGLVAFPTETVYGLGANALDAVAVAKIFVAKGRPATNPLIVHVASIEQAKKLTESWPHTVQKLAERFWPGPLTLVLGKLPVVPDIVTAGGDTVAIRWPSHAVARGLIDAAGVPLAAPSANRSTHLSPTLAEHVLQGLDGRIDMLLDGGATAGGLESTVLDVTVLPPRLLRPGLVARSEIESVLGQVAAGHLTAEAGEQVARSPGMTQRHYAPTTPLECHADSWWRVEELCQKGNRVGWLLFHPPPNTPRCGVFTIELSSDPAEYAARLYAALHTLEAMQLDRIIVEMPPERDAWLAVRDRLRRAATPSEEIG